MLTRDKIEQLPQNDRVVARASHEYYWLLLAGASKDQRQEQLRVWWKALQRQWPDIC